MQSDSNFHATCTRPLRENLRADDGWGRRIFSTFNRFELVDIFVFIFQNVVECRR